MSVVLAIDLGTSGPKCAVVDAAGAVRGAGRAAVGTVFGSNGAAEQDPAAVWQATLDTARAALAHWGGSGDDISVGAFCADLARAVEYGRARVGEPPRSGAQYAGAGTDPSVIDDMVNGMIWYLDATSDGPS